MASGIPSRILTMSDTTASSSLPALMSGRTWRARRTNSSTASSRVRGWSGQCSSPGRSSAMRDVTRNLARGAARNQTPTVAAASATRCSKLSRMIRTPPRLAMAAPSSSVTAASPATFGKRTPSAAATVATMPEGLRASVQSQNQTPPPPWAE